MKETIRLKGVVAEDLINYRKPSMFLITSFCNWKCCRDNPSICQNNSLSIEPIKEIDIDNLIKLYMGNPLTEALVIGGLEPFDQLNELIVLIEKFREVSQDDIVIYTGYEKYEIEWMIESLLRFPNIIVKFGRFIPNNNSHYDNILGVNLASDNQYAVRIS